MTNRVATTIATAVLALGALTACGDDAAPAPEPRPWPAPDAWGGTTGPGVPPVSFTDDELFVNCAYLSGGERDVTDHHNLAVMYDGYLLMPWAPEWGGGGLTFFDLSEPCDPVPVGSGYASTMRESHSIGFSSIGGRWAVVNSLESINRGGVQFWDLADVTNPTHVADLNLPNFLYPDAYARVVLSVFWQGPFVYAAHADNGVVVIDATDPTAPEIVTTITFDPVIRTGQVQAIGDLLVVTGAETPDTALIDISDPYNPVPILGGRFLVQDDAGDNRDFYFSNTSNGFIYYARKSSGGGLIIYDIRDPQNPNLAGSYRSNGNGGYVFVHEDYAFVGESSFGALYSIADHANIEPLGRFELTGDLDTVTPAGHLAIVAVDDGANRGEGTAIAPWRTTPDTNPPVVTWAWPRPDSVDLRPTSRLGLTFNEMIEPMSVFAGSVRLYEADTDPELTRVDVFLSAQETIVNVWPEAPLRPGVTYELHVPAGGVTDVSGNAIAEPFTARYTVADP